MRVCSYCYRVCSFRDASPANIYLEFRSALPPFPLDRKSLELIDGQKPRRHASGSTREHALRLCSTDFSSLRTKILRLARSPNIPTFFFFFFCDDFLYVRRRGKCLVWKGRDANFDIYIYMIYTCIRTYIYI